MKTIDQLQAILDPAKRQNLRVQAISSEMINNVPQIKCKDGFTVSMQASAYHYCSPRDSKGPWTQVELGYPSASERALLKYAEERKRPTGTVYGWVPLTTVARVIDRHGGLVS